MKKAIAIFSVSATGLLICMLLTECSSFSGRGMNIENKLEHVSDLEVFYYRPSGVMASGNIQADHPALIKILEKVNVDELHWKRSWVSYVPHLTLRSGDFRLDIHPDFMVVNYRLGKNRWGQWGAPLDQAIDTEALVKEFGLKFIPNFKQLDPRQRKALFESKRPSDIQRQQD